MPDDPNESIWILFILIFLDSNFIGFVFNDAGETGIAEGLLKMGNGMEGRFGLEVPGKAGAGMELSFIGIIEEVDVGPLDWHG
jgi:hypothetical protein